MVCNTEYWERVEKLKSLMSRRGFVEIARNHWGNELQSIVFGYEKNEEPYPISCTVYNNPDKDFEFSYVVPGSINKLVSPQCGPYTNDKHFDRIFQKFYQQVQILEMNFGGVR